MVACRLMNSCGWLVSRLSSGDALAGGSSVSDPFLEQVPREEVSLQLLQVKNYFPTLNLWLTDEGVSDVFHDDGRCFALIGKDEHEP